MSDAFTLPARYLALLSLLRERSGERRAWFGDVGFRLPGADVESATWVERLTDARWRGMHPDLIPFAEDGFDNQFCFVRSERRSMRRCRAVVYWTYETYRAVPIASSFDAFLRWAALTAHVSVLRGEPFVDPDVVTERAEPGASGAGHRRRCRRRAHVARPATRRCPPRRAAARPGCAGISGRARRVAAASRSAARGARPVRRGVVRVHRLRRGALRRVPHPAARRGRTLRRRARADDAAPARVRRRRGDALPPRPPPPRRVVDRRADGSAGRPRHGRPRLERDAERRSDQPRFLGGSSRWTTPKATTWRARSPPRATRSSSGSTTSWAPRFTACSRSSTTRQAGRGTPARSLVGRPEPARSVHVASDRVAASTRSNQAVSRGRSSTQTFCRWVSGVRND